MFAHRWKEKAGRADAAATDYFVYGAVLRVAHRANREEVSVSVRRCAEEAGIASLETVTKSLARLEQSHKLLKKRKRKSKIGGKAGKAATYKIEAVPIVEHTTIDTGGDNQLNNPCLSRGVPLLGSQQIRNTSPERPQFDKNGRPTPKRVSPPVESVGKVAAWVLDLVHTLWTQTGEPVCVDLLRELTGIETRHLKERPIAKLREAGLIVQVGDGYATPDDIAQRLKEEVEISFSKLALREQKKRHEEQSRLHRVTILHRQGQDPETIAAETGLTVEQVAAVLRPPDHAPTLEEMRETRKPSGEVRELERHAPEWDTFVPTDEPQPPISLSDHRTARRTGVA
jgi:hypothetical protein